MFSHLFELWKNIHTKVPFLLNLFTPKFTSTWFFLVELCIFNFFLVADYEFEVKIAKFKMVDPIWWSISISIKVADDYEFSIRFYEFKMADLI